LEKGPVVVYFYPAALTPGCTKESCHFRDLSSELGALGASCVGISADPVDKQKLFDTTHSLGFPLLSDPDHKVADAFGVKRSVGFLPNKRATFVVDRDGTIRDVIASEINMNLHADRSIETLKSL
jgi:peroxiredoxin Q/BCP